MDICPGAETAPLGVNHRIKQGVTQFLVIWNFPILFCWDQVLEFLLDTVKMCRAVTLLQVLRTNKMGYQVFWLVFKNAEQAQNFRGLVAGRYTEQDQLVNCDYVDQDDYSSVAGHCVD